jgi:predicted RNA-binding Zn-ribbon protein involved in translation (DUF1610 family)
LFIKEAIEMKEKEVHPCPECGQPMILKAEQVNFCTNTAEFPEAPCPGEDPTTHTQIEGIDTEVVQKWYCPQCTITD